MDIEKFIDALKLSPRYLAPVAIASGALLFGPQSFLKKIGLDALLTEHRVWVGLVFLGSTSILVVQVLGLVWDRLVSWNAQRQLLATGRERIKDLTPEEKQILGMFIFGNTKTLRLNVQSGVVNGLEHAMIIYRSASVGSMLEGFAYNMQPWAWKYLRKHPELLADEVLRGSHDLESESRPRTRLPRRSHH